MTAALRNGFLMVAYALIGLVAYVFITQIELLFFLIQEHFYDSPYRTRHWSEIDFLRWLTVCLTVISVCSLTAAALRLRFFALVAGTVLIVMAPLTNFILLVIFSEAGEADRILWPNWYGELLPVLLGSMLVTAHFLVPARAANAPTIPSAEDEPETEEPADTAVDERQAAADLASSPGSTTQDEVPYES